MQPPNNDLKEHLPATARSRSATSAGSPGKQSRFRSWFELEGEKLSLLPVRGSDTQWFKNLLQNPSIRIDARGVEAGFRAAPVVDANGVKSVVEKFRDKYGVKDVTKYYSKFDVAVVVALS